MAEPILNPQAEQAAPLGRDFSRENATLKRIGANPLTLGTLDQKTLFEATYKPEELKNLPDYQKLTQLQGNLSNAEANLGTAERAAAPSTLRILEEALRTKNDVGVQPLGQSDLFKQAGLTGYSTLNQSLAQRGREMQDRYGSFVNQLSKVSGVLKDNYTVALSEYGRLNEKYKTESERFNKVLDEIAAQERQFELLDKQEEILKQRKKEEFSWNTDLKKWTNAYGETREPTPEQSAASQAWQSGLVRSAQSSDITGQTVIDEYNPYGDNCALYVQNKLKWVTPGMGNVEQRKANVAKNGFTDPSKVKVGDVVLTSEGKAVDSNGIPIGHTAIITNINNGIITLEEANYKAGKVTTGRNMSVNDASIIGFLSPESVQRKGALPQEAVNMFAVRQDRGWDPATEGVNPAIEDQYIASGDAATSGKLPSESQDDFNLAMALLDPRSSATLADLTATQKANVLPIINRLKSQYPDTITGAMLASAGGKTPDQTFRTSFSKAATVIDQLAQLNTMLNKDSVDVNGEKVDISPLSGWLAEKNPWDTDAQKIQAILQGTIPNLARGIFGEVGVLTDRDVELYRKTLPNLRQTADVKKAVTGLTLRTIRNSLDNQVAIAAGSGLDVSGLAPFYEKLDNKVNQIESEIGIGSANTSENINLSDLDFKF